MKKQRGNNKGFTLLEVLVSLAIVSIAAVGILSLNNDLFRFMGNSRNMDALALLAQEAAYEHGTNLRHPTYSEGVFDPPNDDCIWAIRSESLDESAEMSTLAVMRLTVDCGWNEIITVESAVPVTKVPR